MEWSRPKLILFCAAAAVIACFIYLDFYSPVLYDPDSYYNIAVSGFIKNLGLHYQFRWAQFSTFKEHFADKDLLLHIVCIPFLYLTDNLVLAGKYSIVLCMILFVLTYLFVLRRYLPESLAAVFLLLPFLSPVFSAYILELRSVTIANILLIAGIFFLITKRPVWLFAISVIYPLAHLSFFTIIIFAVGCEALRHIFYKDPCAKNLYAVITGSILGCVMHPNFPNNFIPVYLNGILVPLHVAGGIDLGFSGETKALGAGAVLADNFAIFSALIIILWALLRYKKKISFASAVWFTVSGAYLVLALFSARYWYQANAIFFISLASYTGDLLKAGGRAVLLARIKKLAIFCFVLALPFIAFNAKQLKSFLDYFAATSTHYENIAKWMERNIPENQTIYHSNWDDSSYFICLNPKNNYINTNDPIYMRYIYPREFAIIDDLSMGRVNNPHEVLDKIFKTRYGYLRKAEPLYRQIANDTKHFKILYENNSGSVFELIF